MKAIDKKILPGAELMETALILKKAKVMVISDLHLGFEDAQIKQGTLLPRLNFSEIKKMLERIFGKFGAFEKIVINGDFKHKFGIPSEQEWREALEMLEFLQAHCREIVLVQGNHDTMLGPIAAWHGIKIVPDGYFLEKEKIFITHGHKLFLSPGYLKARTVIVSHDHVAVVLSEGAKHERFKCFLKGKYEGKTIIAMPSTSPFAPGVNVLSSKLLSPFLQGDILGWECWVAADKTYYFGRLKNIEKMF